MGASVVIRLVTAGSTLNPHKGSSLGRRRLQGIVTTRAVATRIGHNRPMQSVSFAARADRRFGGRRRHWTAATWSTEAIRRDISHREDKASSFNLTYRPFGSSIRGRLGLAFKRFLV